MPTEDEAMGFAMLQIEVDGKREGTLEKIAIRDLAQRYRSCYPTSPHEFA
jgi:hypothetical protein